MPLADGGGASASTAPAPPKKEKKLTSAEVESWLKTEAPGSKASFGADPNAKPEDFFSSLEQPAQPWEGLKVLPAAAETPARRVDSELSDLASQTAQRAAAVPVVSAIESNQREGTESSLLKLGREQDFAPQDTVTPVDRAEIERDMVEAADNAKRRGINQGAGRGVEQMTLEKYQALNPKQRAAVDLNTMLVAAVKEDLALRAGGKNPGGTEYDAQFAEVFGEQDAARGDDLAQLLGGPAGVDADTLKTPTARYAPNTVELLDRINYDGTGLKLNDFLKLKVGFTANDLEDLEPEQGGPDLSLKTSMKQREDLQAALVNSIRGVRKDPADSNALLTQQRDLLGTNEQPGFGPANPQGTNDEQRNHFFQAAFDSLARPENDTAKILKTVESQLTEQDWAAFQAYMQVRSRESKQYSLPLGQDPSADYASPKVFRAKTGLNR